MLEITIGRSNKNCDGLRRRDLLKVGALTIGGMTVAESLRQKNLLADTPRRRTNKSVICFWLDGGPTHIDTYDPKPDAPSEYRGPFRAIQTAVPGVMLNERFPKHAGMMDKLSLVRSLYHNNGDHFAAAHWMWTGYYGSTAANLPQMYPSIGSVTSKVCGPNRQGMPAFVAVPYAATIGLRPGYQGGAFLGVNSNPFDTGSDPNNKNFAVKNLTLPNGVNEARVEGRQGLLGQLDQVRREVDRSGLMAGMDRFNQEAFDLITGREARQAFNIHGEDPKLRDRYGRNSVGQGALLARRLVEAGVTFVSVHSGGWDNHSNIEGAMNGHGPRMDSAVSALVEDLQLRGLYDDVIVMVMGEFGRTPRVNGSAGRDHWGNALSVLLAGGGIQPGRVVGATDAKGTRPIERPVKPAHILHTIYHQLGIDPSVTHLNRAGRPIPILNEGEVIRELV